MAQRRMFSLKIVDTDAFLDMPQSSQLLYFHLSMRADDDGFVSNPKKIMRIIGSNEDDLKVLFTKRFVLPFESGICVIKHWKIHNYIQNDRYMPTQWVKEMSQLKVDPETQKYQLKQGEIDIVLNNVSMMDTQVRLGKDRKEEYLSYFDKFWEKYPRKVGRKNAEKEWKRITPSEVLSLEICAAVENYKETDQWKKDNGQFIPYPATWLHQERWKDEITVGKNKFL